MKEQWEIIVEGLNEVSKLDDSVIKAVQDIKLVLFNLQIEAAHIEAKSHVKTGITPICNYLNTIVDNLNNAGKNILSLRKDVNIAKIELTNYFNSKE